MAADVHGVNDDRRDVVATAMQQRLVDQTCRRVLRVAFFREDRLQPIEIELTRQPVRAHQNPVTGLGRQEGHSH